jgi:hypothetical protein
MVKKKGINLYVVVIGSKGKKKLKGIPIGLDGMLAAAFSARKVLIKELMDNGGQFHSVLFEIAK